jgi:trk system potassium uptake protein TrkH
VLVSMIAVESVGAILLWLHWRNMLGNETAAFYGLFHAVSAFCNAGFSLFAGSQYPGGIPVDTVSLILLGWLIVLGGLGFPVLANLVGWTTRRRLSLHTRLTIYTAAILIVGGAIGLMLAENWTGGALVGVPWHRQVVLSMFNRSRRARPFFGDGEYQQLTGASQCC